MEERARKHLDVAERGGPKASVLLPPDQDQEERGRKEETFTSSDQEPNMQPVTMQTAEPE